MIIKNELDFTDLVKNALDKLPEGFSKGREELEKHLVAMLQATFARFDLVSREEFDIQSKLLAKTREKAESLARRVALLEQSIASSSHARD